METPKYGCPICPFSQASEAVKPCSDECKFYRNGECLFREALEKYLGETVKEAT